MRLIDADAFLERFEAMCETKTDSVISMVVRGALADEPTAYEVDKVVQQLEEVGQKMSESKSIQKYGKSSPANHRYYKAVSVKRAIEIVKGGGVNEKGIEH